MNFMQNDKIRGLGLMDAKHQEEGASPTKETGESPDVLANHTLNAVTKENLDL